MEKVREAIADPRSFMKSSSFDPWDDISSGGFLAYVDRYCTLFDVYLENQKKGSCQRLRNSGRWDQKMKFAGDGESSTTIFLESVSSSTASVSIAAVDSSGSAIHSRLKRHSTLSSLLGRKKSQQEEKKTTKKPSLESGKIRAKGQNK